MKLTLEKDSKCKDTITVVLSDGVTTIEHEMDMKEAKELVDALESELYNYWVT